MEPYRITYRPLNETEIDRSLFAGFIRRQEVGLCRRKINGRWQLLDDPFIDDWNEEDYARVVRNLKKTVQTGGLAVGAFADGCLKGFVSVEKEPLGRRAQYMDLSHIHVSADMRGRGIGRVLFDAAKAYAREHGAEKLYISAHSAVESQAFYRAMHCREAEEYSAAHVEAEPCDCQLECVLSGE